MKYQTILAAAGSVLLAACGVTDREHEPSGAAARAPAATATRYADADRDGKVSRQEAQADPALARSFPRYDANRDGQLDRAEFARLEAQSAVARDERTAAPRPYGKPK
jgi:hypothetical protein